MSPNKNECNHGTTKKSFFQHYEHYIEKQTFQIKDKHISNYGGLYLFAWQYFSPGSLPASIILYNDFTNKLAHN